MFLARGENEGLKLTGSRRRWVVLIDLNCLTDLSVNTNVMPGGMSRDRGEEYDDLSVTLLSKKNEEVSMRPW